MPYRRLCALLLLTISVVSFANEKPLIRIGSVANGTLAWELQAMRDQGLLDQAHFKLDITTLANPQAGKVALQAKNVDLIISDWIWVSTMRHEGSDLTFSPYSNSAGALLTAANNTIQSITDLQGKKLGIAGGELDKNWLLLQALGNQHGIDLNQSVEKVYGAPPLLEQQLKAGRIDALLTYWQFAASLEAEGYHQLLSGESMIHALGIKDSVPSLGYVFSQNWAKQHQASLQEFLNLAKQARNQLCENDAAWQKIAPLTETTEAISQQKIRQHYCAGRIQQWSEQNRAAAGEIYKLLHTISRHQLGGEQPSLSVGSFWLTD